MDIPNPHNASIIEIIGWLNSLPAVTDFEEFALAELKNTCDRYDIESSYIGNERKQLFIGSKSAKVVFIAHIDRVGFVATKGEFKCNSILEVSYIQPPKGSKRRKEIEERFKGAEFIGYDHANGETLFIAKLETGSDNKFRAKITEAVKPKGHEINEQSPIPMTAVKPPEQIEGDRWKGTFDNSAGVAISLLAVAKFPSQLACIVTTREEGPGYNADSKSKEGRRGAYEYGRDHHDPKKLLVVIDDRPSESEECPKPDDDERTYIGKGVVLRKHEKKCGLDADKEILKYVESFCKKQEIQFQGYKDKKATSKTEAGRVHEALKERGYTLRCIWLQPPVACNHYADEEVSLPDLEATLRVAEVLADDEFQKSL